MSRFLGPIHHWLYNKIKLYEELEAKIIVEIKEKIDPQIVDASESLISKIGSPMPNKSLEEIIDTDNIHGWLQSKIVTAETRQAALITHIVFKYGNEGLEKVKEIYRVQGMECGKDASERYDVYSAPQIYKALNNYVLDGMPCDHATNVTINEQDHIQWKVSNCLHKGYWEQVGGDLDNFYELRNIWVASFVSNVNASYSYTFEVNNISGIKEFVYEIKK